VISPFSGQKFLHKYWVGNDGKPMLYKVTAVRSGVIYIKPDGSRKSKEFVELSQWHKVFGSIA